MLPVSYQSVDSDDLLNPQQVVSTWKENHIRLYHLVNVLLFPVSSSSGDFISDVDLMFSNCLQYNPRHTNEAKAGLRLHKFFISALARLGLSDVTSFPPPAKRFRH